MAKMISPGMVALLNKSAPGFVVYAHMVPTRIIRVSADENFCTFRVEQLVRANKDNMNPLGEWRTLSTHGSPNPGVMLETAMAAGFKAQRDLVNKLKQRAQAANPSAIYQ